jgi:uncharacterized protein YdeI (YjbR/CyaY-like superfamily)
MPTKDPRIDAYIAKSADFARPILAHLRKLVHAACPEVEETIKWSFPHFSYKGMLCGMAAFKQHCVFGFAKHSLVVHEQTPGEESAVDRFGRITKLTDLPPQKTLLRYVKKAVQLNDAGIKLPRPKKPKKKPLSVPNDMLAALKKNKAALAAFENFSPSNRREYIEWITEAKRPETRQRRLATALQWLAQGKPRNWKYMKC